MHWRVFKTGIMKIKVYQYFAWFCLGLCTACYSGMPEYEGKVGQGKEVTFRISRFDETFSRATATNFEVGDSIGIYAVKHDATGGNSFPALFGNQAHNAKWVKTDEGWQPSSLWDKIVYPQDGAKLDFYAYYPYSRDAIDPEAIAMGVKPDQRTVGGRNGSDWMVATNTIGVNEGEVELLFRHVMAAVEVEIRGGDVIMPNEKLEVQMTEVCLTNSHHLGTGMFVAENGTGTIDMWRLENATDMDSFTYRALLPAQTLGKGIPVFRCLQDGKIYIYRGEEIILERGNRTRFVFTLKSGSEL
ncbi:fimbrillin family protein [Butyricimonas virosa]|jgi:hypothetical protein|uniref:Fimbrillin family protein n=2 Tax=Butyricimonas virosa TaxID=544645 RepID=A0A412X543_9BACT|nr:fimbrillin family protein [Butyricimonas virosa]RGY20404.1 fimbrillin family protein [Butyricimonas virosa]RHI24901.1 fimbrillin family protein [Butyricimonas virosa]